MQSVKKKLDKFVTYYRLLQIFLKQATYFNFFFNYYLLLFPQFYFEVQGRLVTHKELTSDWFSKQKSLLHGFSFNGRGWTKHNIFA